MRNLYLVLFFLVIAGFANAQNPIPNPGFETAWSGGKPNNWSDSRDITQVTQGHTGSFAAQGLKSQSTYPAFSTSSSNAGISISSSYTYLNLYYKFKSDSADVMFISATVHDASSSQIGSGVSQITQTATNYTPLSVLISYGAGTPHDIVVRVIMNSSLGGNPSLGSYFIIDDLSLSGAPTAIEEKEKESLSLQVFPNPASNFIRLNCDACEEQIFQVQISDIFGRVVRNISASSNDVFVDTGDLPTGNYIVAVRNDEMILNRRFIKR